MKGATNMHYHKNARTNIAQRKAIKENNRENNKELAAHYLSSPIPLASGSIQTDSKIIPVDRIPFAKN